MRLLQQQDAALGDLGQTAAGTHAAGLLHQSGRTVQIVAGAAQYGGLLRFDTSSSEYWQTSGGGTVDGFLKAVFQDALGRQIDPVASTYFSGLMTKGMSAAKVAEAVFGSDEYHRLRVDSLFEQLFHRPADPDALTYFAGKLDGGTTDEVVISQMLSSKEYYDDVQL